jgi:hypothetical protein
VVRGSAWPTHSLHEEHIDTSFEQVRDAGAAKIVRPHAP